MCDIIQCVVDLPISGYTSAIINQCFMQDVFMNFGLYHLVLIDEGTLFKSIFTAMCDCVTINYQVVATYNHKGVSIERFHRFLNKVGTIAFNDRDTVSMFVKVVITVVYTWSSAPIDSISIIRSILAIGRDYVFLWMLPRPFTNFVSKSSRFSSKISASHQLV